MSEHTTVETAAKLQPHAEFAERLHALRKARSMSQLGLAMEIGVAQNVISGWEKKRSKPTDEMLDRLIRFFGEERGAMLLEEESA